MPLVQHRDVPTPRETKAENTKRGILPFRHFAHSNEKKKMPNGAHPQQTTNNKQQEKEKELRYARLVAVIFLLDHLLEEREYAAGLSHEQLERVARRERGGSACGRTLRRRRLRREHQRPAMSVFVFVCFIWGGEKKKNKKDDPRI